MCFFNNLSRLFQNNLVTLIFAIGCIRNVSAAAFSNVIVRRGPVQYLNYDPATFSFARPQLAQLSAGPIESVVPIPSVPSVVSPCVSPCVIRNGPPTGVTPISATTNARIVALKSTLANVPVSNYTTFKTIILNQKKNIYI